MKQLDLTKPLRTVNLHEPVRLLCTDRKYKGGKADYPCLGLITTADGSDALVSFDENGCVVAQTNRRIENGPIKVTKWINIVRAEGVDGGKPYPSCFQYDSKREALLAETGIATRVDTIQIEYEVPNEAA